MSVRWSSRRLLEGTCETALTASGAIDAKLLWWMVHLAFWSMTKASEPRTRCRPITAGGFASTNPVALSLLCPASSCLQSPRFFFFFLLFILTHHLSSTSVTAFSDYICFRISAHISIHQNIPVRNSAIMTRYMDALASTAEAIVSYNNCPRLSTDSLGFPMLLKILRLTYSLPTTRSLKRKPPVMWETAPFGMFTSRRIATPRQQYLKLHILTEL